MANPICLSPLKFYDSLAKQNHRKSYAYGHVAPVIMQKGVIDAFQFVLPQSIQASIESIDLVNFITGQSVDILGTLTDNGLNISEIEKYNVVSYPGFLPITLVQEIFEGEYYLQIHFTDATYYSEVFCFSSNTNDCLQIVYYNPESPFYIKGGIIDLTNTRFTLRLKSELGKPEYSFEEEATKRLGYNFVESQVSKKTYRFNTVIPEYLCDALRIVRLCSHKVLTSLGEDYDMIAFNMDVDWQEQGDLASVTCEFDVDNIIVNIGGYTVEFKGGDFNDDFNDDFNKQFT